MKSHEFIVEAEEVEEMTDMQRKRMTMLKGKSKSQDTDTPQVKRKPSGPASQSTAAVAESELDEAYGLKKRVKIVRAPAPLAWIGKYGWIGEIRHGLHNKSPKMYTIDLDHGGGSIILPKEALRLVKDIGEEKNPHSSALGKALHRDLSKEKHASPTQKEKNKERWAKNPHNPNKTVAESDGGASCSSAIAAGPVPSLFKAPVKRVKETVSQSPVPKQKKARN